MTSHFFFFSILLEFMFSLAVAETWTPFAFLCAASDGSTIRLGVLLRCDIKIAFHLSCFKDCPRTRALKASLENRGSWPVFCSQHSGSGLEALWENADFLPHVIIRCSIKTSCALELLWHASLLYPHEIFTETDNVLFSLQIWKPGNTRKKGSCSDKYGKAQPHRISVTFTRKHKRPDS